MIGEQWGTGELLEIRRDVQGGSRGPIREQRKCGGRGGGASSHLPWFILWPKSQRAGKVWSRFNSSQPHLCSPALPGQVNNAHQRVYP